LKAPCCRRSPKSRRPHLAEERPAANGTGVGVIRRAAQAADIDMDGGERGSRIGEDGSLVMLVALKDGTAQP